jgi:hypothetical protein
MTKDEALAKIEELRQFVEEMDKPKVKKGQVWLRYNGNVVITTGPRSFVVLSSSNRCDKPGEAHDLDISPSDTYVGYADDILTINR